MSKALTKEDLIYILQAVLTISKEPNNALTRDDSNGLYVKNYTNDLDAHINDVSVHVTQNILDILKRITVNENNEILIDNKKAITRISEEPNNGIIEKNDGLYAPAIMLSKQENNSLILKEDGLYNEYTDAAAHVNNDGIHVTQSDKDTWNAILKDSKSYTDSKIDKLPILDFCFTTSLPTENQDSSILYFLADDPDKPLECTYTVYIWRDNVWYGVGVTKQTLDKYITNEQFTKAIESLTHNNRTVLDKLSEDINGYLCYNEKGIFDNLRISSDKHNALTSVEDGLYVKDYGQEISSMITGSPLLVKSNLYNTEISESGVYTLRDSIDNYNLILVEYYYKPNKSSKGTPGCIQTAIIDPDTLNEAYSKGMLYILQYGYGTMTSNSQIHIVKNKLTVDYYHNVCIYKITGIKRGDKNVGEEI